LDLIFAAFDRPLIGEGRSIIAAVATNDVRIILQDDHIMIAFVYVNV
jgi:hypothetical protein